MKNIIAAAIMASMALSTTAQAGSLVYTPEQAPIIVEEAPMGSSGAWIIPLIAIGLICVAICGGDDNGNGQTGNGQIDNGGGQPTDIPLQPVNAG